MDDRLLTEEQFADRVGWTLDWARKQRRRGNGPEYIRLADGGSIRYRESAIEAWLNARTHNDGDDEAAS